MDDFEELVIDEGQEFEEIEKYVNVLDTPMAVFNYGVYFNKAAQRLIPKYVKWLTNAEYVIGLPAKKDDSNAYGTYRRSDSHGVTTAFPVVLRRDKRLKLGYYKLYKYKDGFAIKRFEPIKLIKEKKNDDL